MATRPVARPWRLALLALLAGPAWIGPRGSAVPARAAPVARASGRSSEWPEMFAWVKSTGMDTSDIQVQVEPTEELAKGELGLITTAPLQAGDILAWAPTKLLLNKQKAVDIWGSKIEDLSDRLALILLLIQERFVHGADSKWHVYMRSLPRFDGDVSGPSFLWSEEEIEELQGSDGYGAALAMYNAVVDEYEFLNATLFKDHETDFPQDTFSFDHFLWGAANVASRAYGDDADGTNLCIAPLVDFLNHKAGALQLTRFGNGIVAYAHKHYEAGEQVWVSYGGKSNAELLSQYGFVDPDNGQEAVYIRMGEHLTASEEKMTLIAELLEVDSAEGAIFRLSRRPREWEPKLLPVLRVVALEGELPSAEEMIPRAPELEAAAYRALQRAIDLRAAEYPRLDSEAPQELDERRALARKLRVSEGELLELVKTYALDQELRASG